MENNHTIDTDEVGDDEKNLKVSEDHLDWILGYHN